MATIKGRKDASLVIVFNKTHNFSYQDNPWHTRWGGKKDALFLAVSLSPPWLWVNLQGTTGRWENGIERKRPFVDLEAGEGPVAGAWAAALELAGKGPCG